MTNPRHPKLVAAVLAGLLCARVAPTAQSAQPAAQDPLVFRAGTTLVPIDVRVLDRSGKPVTDLTPADFTVTENNVRQNVRHFSTQSYTAQAPGPSDVLVARRTQTDDIAPQNRRVFLLVLGRGRLQPPSKGVDGMVHLVRDRLLPQDLVAVVAWNRATEFTTDHAKIAELLDRFKRAHEGIEAELKNAFSGLAAVYGSKEIPAGIQRKVDAVFGGPPGLAGVRSTQPSEGGNATRMGNDRRDQLSDLMDATRSDATGAADVALEEFVQADTQTMQDLGKLYAGIEYLRHFEGEKHLVFVSESGLVLPRGEDDRDLGALAADARVAIDYVHTGGTPLIGLNPGASAAGVARRGGGPVAPRSALPSPAGWQMSTARTLADLTGGRFYANQLPDAAADMDDDDQATRFEYILGYYSSNPSVDGKYRQIRVRVNRPGLTVLYRHGYYAGPTLAPMDRQHLLTYSRIAAAATYPNSVPDIGLRATASAPKTPGPVEIRVDLTIDPTRLGFTAANGLNKDTLEVLVGCLDARDNLLTETWKTVQLTYNDARLDAVKRAGVPLTLTLSAGSPAKNVKIVVYDYAADLVGTTVVKVQ